MSNRKFVELFNGLENLLAFFTIFLLALFPFLEVIARTVFHTGVANSTVFTHHLVLILAFIGAVITARENKHLSLTLNWKLPAGLLKRIQVVSALINTTFCTAFAWISFSFLLNAFGPEEKVAIFPLRWITMVMPLGYLLMAVRFITHTPPKPLAKIIAALGLILGTLLALGAIANVSHVLLPSAGEFLDSLVPIYNQVLGRLVTPLILVLIVSAVFGVPIFIVLGGLGFLFFAKAAQPLEVMANEAYSLLTSHAIAAIPLFTFTGFVLSESKASERLVKLFKAFFSWFPGGLAIMAILVCTFFTTFTGASGVTILAVGGLLSYVLIKGNYSPKFSTGLLTATGSIGLLFPPSLPVIIYGVTAQISIKDMFIGGIVPGILMVLTMIIFGIWYAIRNKVTRQHFVLKEAFTATKDSFWELLLPVIIVYGYFGGITTLVESGAIAVIYALFIEVVIHKDLKIKDLPQVLLKCMPVMGGVLAILALAKGLSYYVVDAEIPMQLTAWVQIHISSKYVFLLLLNIGLLITGCFMDIFSAILVVVPLIIPVANLFGIHPVHLGIIFLANLELGYLTPPLGLNLFLASYRFNEPMGKVVKDVFPFLIIQLVAVLLITYVPFLTTGLLTLFK
ncbi:MAG: TRAP transporter large permease subunit [Candidatus Aminicenantes bacterium]|nr:TRAP transporter large permease subunit [Candidatus Aminicenantes bacterium]